MPCVPSCACVRGETCKADVLLVPRPWEEAHADRVPMLGARMRFIDDDFVVFGSIKYDDDDEGWTMGPDAREEG